MAAVLDITQYPKVLVGNTNKKNLPDVPKDEFLPLRGKFISKGHYGRIYEKEGDPTRIYKVIERWYFDGNEVRAAKIAGRVGIAPAPGQSHCLLTQSFDNTTNVCLGSPVK